jgi:hypothetical protein
VQYLIPVVALLAACPEGEPEMTVSASCTGSPVNCLLRLVDQCNGGCTQQVMCLHIDFEHCVRMRDANTCRSDSKCRWLDDVCRPPERGSCTGYESQAACDNDPFDECVWADGCAGLPQPCANARTAESCNVIVGCTWADK